MQSYTPSSAMMHRVLRFAVVTAMWVLVVTGLSTFGFFYIMTPTRWFYVNATDFLSWRSSLVLQYTFVNATTGKVTPLLPNTYSFILIWQWCATLAAALGAAGLLWEYSSANKRAQPASSARYGMHAQFRRRRSPSCITWISKGAVRIRRLLQWQVPPRGLWRKVLGPDGLSVLDLILLLLWFGLHIMWLREMTMKTLDARRAPAAVKVVSTTVKSNSSATLKSNTTATRATNSSSALPSPSPPSFNSSSGVNLNKVTAAPARLRSQLEVTNTTGTTPTIISSNRTLNSTKSNYTTTITHVTTKNSTSTSTATKTTTLKPLPREVQNSMAKYTGMVGNFDLLMLFFPLPRCNFLHWLLQSDFPRMVKYHRWLGHGTLMMYSLHGIIYMALWTKDGTLSANMQWSMNSYVNNIAGLISLIAGWILWVTSIPYIRRRFFNLFYASHIGGTVVFMLFAFMHRKDIAPWVMPGIFLYLLDVVLRTLQQAFNSTSITASASVGPEAPAAAFLSPHGNILTLTIQCDKSLSWSGLDIVFLNVPEISWWQWHPFTLATSSVAGGPETKMVLHIKTYNHWTQRLVARLATNTDSLKLYVSGPYHGAHRKWITNFDRHIFVAGGIGVTPVLGMLQDLIARRRAMAANSDLKPAGRVSLIWLSRSRDELATMPYDVLQEASKTGADAWLDLQLYLTSPDQQQQEEEDGRDPVIVQENAAQGGERSRRNSNVLLQTAVSIPLGGRLGVDGVRPSGDSLGTTTTSSKSCTAARPLAHPYMLNPQLWAVAVVLCFAGGFAGFICSQAYDAHISRTVAVRNDYAHVGMLQFAALGLGATLPPALLMLAAHMLLRIKSWRRCTADAEAAGSEQSKHCPSTLIDMKDAAASCAACRVTSILHARTSVNSTVTHLSEDNAMDNSNFASFCDAAAPCGVTGVRVSCNGSKHVPTQGHICAEPYIKHGRPDLAVLLAAITRTGSTAAATAAVTWAHPQPAPNPNTLVAEPQQLSRLDNQNPTPGTPRDPIPRGNDVAGDQSLPQPPLAPLPPLPPPPPQDAYTDQDPSDLRVAVFVAGPRLLVETVEERCARLNGVWGRKGRCYLELHPLTHEL
ncbi:hypothetical protein VaNZ11_009641 [Volvox africanus]|uniref:FAD-binding FR-type domain-containing protein n=1 Tax=Volvox africanus TaxID=51714 RepID=A0ABQ5S960_9CHLO|nr:hypothetical protein VaNZ11_009641 [Volvox africanus]